MGKEGRGSSPRQHHLEAADIAVSASSRVVCAHWLMLLTQVMQMHYFVTTARSPRNEMHSCHLWVLSHTVLFSLNIAGLLL